VILAFLASRLGAYVIMGALAAGIAGFAWYIWTDREAFQIENAALVAANLEWERAVDRVREAGERRVAAERASAAAIAVTLERRNDDLAGLSAQILEIRSMETPDDEADCPVPAAVRRAVELLRDDAAE